MNVEIVEHNNPKVAKTFKQIMFDGLGVGLSQLYENECYVMMTAHVDEPEQRAIESAVVEYYGVPLAKFCNQPAPEPPETDEPSYIITEIYDE